MIKFSQKAIAINVGAGTVIVAAFISFVHATFARPHFEVCTSRYHRQVTMQLDRNGTPMTAADVQAVSNGQDEGLLDNLSIAQFRQGPAKFAMGIRLAEGSSEQRSSRATPGGISLPWTPSTLEQPSAACLSYNVFLPLDFDFGGGGTLPGLFATTINAQYQDMPHVAANLAWHGAGEPKLYVQTNSQDSQRSATFKAFEPTLARGRWVRVDQELVLNTPGQSDGIARLWLDGRLESEVKSSEIRPGADVTIAGVAGDVFFGGSATLGVAKKEATVWLSPFEIRWN